MAAGRDVEDYGAFVRRIVGAYGRRVGREGGPDDLAALSQLAALVERATVEAVATMREDGATYAELAAGLGVTRQALAQRVGRYERTAGAAGVEGQEEEREEEGRRVVGPGRRGGLRLS